MLIDKQTDTMVSLNNKLRKKFGFLPGAQISKLILQSGELIDDVSLIEKNDRILIEMKILKQEGTSSSSLHERPTDF